MHKEGTTDELDEVIDGIVNLIMRDDQIERKPKQEENSDISVIE